MNTGNSISEKNIQKRRDISAKIHNQSKIDYKATSAKQMLEADYLHSRVKYTLERREINNGKHKKAGL